MQNSLCLSDYLYDKWISWHFLSKNLIFYVRLFDCRHSFFEKRRNGAHLSSDAIGAVTGSKPQKWSVIEMLSATNNFYHLKIFYKLVDWVDNNSGRQGRQQLHNQNTRQLLTTNSFKLLNGQLIQEERKLRQEASTGCLQFSICVNFSLHNIIVYPQW